MRHMLPAAIAGAIKTGEADFAYYDATAHLCECPIQQLAGTGWLFSVAASLPAMGLTRPGGGMPRETGTLGAGPFCPVGCW